MTTAQEFEYRTIAAITPKLDGSGFWVATVDDGVFFVTVAQDEFETVHLDIPDIYNSQVQAVYEDAQGLLWISTFGLGLLRVELAEDMNVYKIQSFNHSNGMGSDNVRQAFFDNRKNLWIATFGQGVASINNFSFSFFDDLTAIDNNATAVFSEDDTEYWIAGTGVIIRITTSPEPQKVIFGQANGLPNDRITALHKNSKGDMFIGTEKSGLYVLPKDARNATLFYIEENSLSNQIQNFVFKGEEIWMATRNGVIIINSQNRQKIEQYTTFDGGLPHNDLRDIFMDSKGRIFIATNSNSLVDVNNFDRLMLPYEFESTMFSTIAEDNHGRIWAGTIGRGIYVFDEQKDTVYHITSANHLFSDFCYAMNYDGNGQMWIGHRLGLSRVDTERFTISAFGMNNGIFGDVNNLAMKLNKSGEMLIGMTDGVMKYDFNADRKDELPPILNLTRLLINDVPYCVHTPIVKKFGRYKLQFDFVGLQYSDPSSVEYQYFLENYDMSWSTVASTTTVIYPRIEDGTYNFWIKACNSSLCTGEILLFSIKIRKPFWKTWWFITLSILSAIALIFTVITVRERNHRKLQEYLEKELLERTREVYKQKGEIERKNKDITDSINYAQRIQYSILPTKANLLDHCSEAFILYRPRDIVSGDFYWFDYFPKDNNLLIICADSTGHGVPGAFMSLIGATLINDITKQLDVKTPADILYRLEKNVQSTLNQNRDSEQTQDGMDVAVCQINTKTYKVKIASAMRPYIIYKDGVRTVYKGSRASIGGLHYHDSDTKVFEINEIQLSKGDTIYMYTDGYADQFGGPQGKKMKTSRLQNILNDVQSRDMEEQRRVLQENFELWKGDQDQVDDVLMIGVRI